MGVMMELVWNLDSIIRCDAVQFGYDQSVLMVKSLVFFFSFLSFELFSF